MRSILLAVVGVLLICPSTFGQKAPIKFGDVPMEDMKMTVYPNDTSAEAAVLADYGTVEIKYNEQRGQWGSVFERTYRIKILTTDGLKHADFIIPLYRQGDSRMRLEKLKAVTYNLVNGQIVETVVEKDSFFKEDFSENFELRKIAWSDVKVGSVLELYYRTSSDFISVPSWNFQARIPTRITEYRTTLPSYFGYQKDMQGYISLSVNETKTQSRTAVYGHYGRSQSYVAETTRMVAENVPAFREEPYMTTANDYMSKIRYELAYIKAADGRIKPVMGTWDQLARTYWEQIGGKITGNDAALKDDIVAIIGTASTDEQKVTKIFEYLRDTVLWTEINDRVPSQSPRKVLETKKGTAADINICLASMIEKTGVPVFPVLLSTRDHGFIRENAPLSSQFDYVICGVRLGDKLLLLDATSRMLPVGVIPEKCLNGVGFMITPTGYEWIEVKPAVKSRSSYTADITITPAGDIDATLAIEKTGYHSSKARELFLKKGEGEYIKSFAPSFDITGSEFTNVNDVNVSFKEAHKIKTTEGSDLVANTIFFNPLIIGGESENPFKAEERLYPVDFGNTFETVYMAKIKVPEGYLVDEVPQSKAISLPGNGGRYSYNVQQNGDVLNISSLLSINRALFGQAEYPGLREFYNQVLAKQAEQIVFKKK